MTKLMNLKNKVIEVLIVEDELVFALGREECLINSGYKVSSIATCYTSAIKQIKKYSPDLVIIDSNLKGKISGIRLAKTIWKNFQIPIVLLKSADAISFKDELKMQPYSYLNKVCNKKSLNIAIKTSLHKHTYFYQNKESFNDELLIVLTNNHMYNKTKKILYKNSIALDLSEKELDFIDVLSENIAEPICYDKIISYIYKYEYTEVTQLKTMVNILKSKLEDELFEDVYDFAYRLKSV